MHMQMHSIKYHWLHSAASAMSGPWGHLSVQSYYFTLDATEGLRGLIYTDHNNKDHADSNLDYIGLGSVSALELMPNIYWGLSARSLTTIYYLFRPWPCLQFYLWVKMIVTSPIYTYVWLLKAKVKGLGVTWAQVHSLQRAENGSSLHLDLYHKLRSATEKYH